MPSVTLEYNGEIANIPHRGQTIQTLKTQAKAVFGLDIPASRLVLVDKYTSIKAFSPVKANATDYYVVYVLPEGVPSYQIDGNIPFNPLHPAVHPIHATHRVGPFLSASSHSIYFLDANVVLSILDLQRTQNDQYIPMLLQDPSVVLIISETCLAEVQRLQPTYTSHPAIHYISSGQSFARKDMIFESFYRLCRFEMPFNTLTVSVQRSIRNDFFVFLEACFIAGGPSFQQAVFSVLTENNQMIESIRGNVDAVQSLIHSYGFQYYLPLTRFSMLLAQYRVV